MSQKESYSLKDLKFDELNDKLTVIKPRDVSCRNHWKDIIENVGGNWKVNKGGWVIPTNKIKEIKEIVQIVNSEASGENGDDLKESNASDNKSSDDSSTDDSSSTDDEMIQKVLARRLKSESTQDLIEEDSISDSENEDVLSLCRRIRHLYKEINGLKTELNYLKGK
jgi:hypothetical protein